MPDHERHPANLVALGTPRSPDQGALIATVERVAVSGRTDPNRRDRIIDATLAVIAAHGVAGTSHRKVAAAAGVPLGSTTYYFAGMDDLLREAFSRFAERGADDFDARMAQAHTPADALEVVTGSIIGDTDGGSDDLVLTYELYTLAARHTAFQDITERWMARTRTAFEKHFDPLTARLLDALMEGLGVHHALDRDPADAALVVEGIRRITRP